MNTEVKRLGDVNDVADLLSISARMVWKMISNGQFGPRAIRLGRSVRFDLAEVERWINAECPTGDKWRQLDGGAL